MLANSTCGNSERCNSELKSCLNYHNKNITSRESAKFCIL